MFIKIYAGIIENSIMNHLEVNKILSQNQGAFRKGRRLEDNLFTLQGLCSARKGKSKHTCLAFLDMSKAFDRVWRDGIFYLLWKYGVKGKVWRLLKEIYKNVTNRVLFGDFESDTFEQMYGLKQGCVTSPTIFNVLMNELINDLNISGTGVRFANTIINSLLFADDIVLIADTSETLENLLHVSNSFAERLNLKLNSSKSKVMVIGKRLGDKDSNIGNYTLKETNEYKYLGVYLPRSMKSHYHINTFIQEKAENKINGLIRLLNDHGDFNRIEFGSAIWQSVILPSVSHGCSVWFSTSISDTNILESLQYQTARAIMKIRSYPLKCALIRELGLIPIQDFLNRQRFAYFSRFKDLKTSGQIKCFATECNSS